MKPHLFNEIDGVSFFEKLYDFFYTETQVGILLTRPGIHCMIYKNISKGYEEKSKQLDMLQRV